MKKLATVITIFLTSFILFACQDTTVTDFSNIESITINFETNSTSTINTIVINQELIESIDIDTLRDVKLEDLNYLIPEKDGFLFGNWYFDENLTQPLEEDSPILEEYLAVLATDSVVIEITLYADWTPVTESTHTITYYLDGGTNNPANPVSFTESEEISLLNPIKSGYTFSGWKSASADGDSITKIAEGTTSDVDVYATWQVVFVEITHTITYHLDGGTNNPTNPATFNESQEISFLSPTRSGYTFSGWKSGSVDGDSITKIVVGTTSDVDVYAIWDEIVVGDTYTITYHLDGGVNSNENPISYKATDSDFNLIPPTKTGNSFMGWFSDASFTTAVITISKGSTGNIDLWAKWGDASMLSFTAFGETYVVSSCLRSYSGKVEIPNTYNGLPVIGIYDNAFGLCVNVTEVVLSENITIIGSSAFYHCESLESINIHNNITTIGVSAFEGCDSLESVVIGDSVTYISAFAFNACENLTTVVLGENVISLGRQSFSYTALETITLSDCLTTISESAFNYCGELTVINIPATVTYIGPYAFGHCDNLTIFCAVDEKPTNWSGDWNFTDCKVVWGDSSENYQTISYHLDGGTNNALNPGFIMEESGFTLLSPEKDGYYFLGWYLESTFTTQVTVLSTDIDHDVTLYALWQESLAPTYLDYTEYETYVAISGINREVAEVEIPDSYHGKPVTTIESRAFYWKLFLTSVTLPETITTIEENAFVNCHNLSKVNFPSSLTVLGDSSFADCGFTSLTLPNTILSFGTDVFGDNSDLVTVVLPENLTVIPESMFIDCDLLQTINIPETVTDIQRAAFAGCLALENVDLTNVSVIGENAFTNCQSFTSIVLSDSLTIIDKYAFAYTNNVVTITLPENLVKIGEAAFSGCYDLVYIHLPSSLEYIGEGAFWGCNLTSIVFPDSLKFIGEHAFRYNDFTHVYLPENLERLEMLAFRDCDELIAVYLPSSIEMVEARVFRDTGYNVSIYIDGNQAPSAWAAEWKDNFHGSLHFNSTFLDFVVSYVLNGGTNSLENPTTFDVCDYKVLNRPTKIDSNFEGWYLDDGFTMPVSVLEQGTNEDITLYAKWSDQPVSQFGIFYYLDGGKNLSSAPMYYDDSLDVTLLNPTKPGWNFLGWFTDSNFENSITTISKTETGDIELYASWEQNYLIFEEFDDYVAVVGLYQPLSVVEIPSMYNGKPVTTIAEECFIYEDMVLEFILPDTITTIGNYAFYCKNLESINLPEGLLTIGNSAFGSCGKLKEITIPSTVISFGTNVFSFCIELETVIFNNPMTILPADTFNYCTSLVNFVVPEGITEIGESAFKNCTALSIVTLPSTLLKIDSYAFVNCKSLTDIILPNGILELGIHAFYETGLTSIAFPDSVTTIGEEAFKYCRNMKTVTIGSGLVTVFTYKDFQDLESLTEFIVSDQNTLYDSIDGILFINSPVYTLLKYPQAKVMNDYSIPSSVIIIGRDALRDTSIRNIFIPDSVTSIEAGAFSNCSKLISVYIPDTVVSMGSYAFYHKDHLIVYTNFDSKPANWSDYWTVDDTTIYWNLTRDDILIYENVFEYIVVDNHIEIIYFILENDIYFSHDIPTEIDGHAVTTIHSYALNNASGYVIAKIIIPNSVTTIYEKAFTGTNYSTSVDIYCQAQSLPAGWDVSWNISRGKIQWATIWFKMDTQGGYYEFPITGTLDDLTSLGYGYTPIKSGYVFDGWYTTPECTSGTEFTFAQYPSPTDIMPSTITTIYAKWIQE